MSKKKLRTGRFQYIPYTIQCGSSMVFAQWYPFNVRATWIPLVILQEEKGDCWWSEGIQNVEHSIFLSPRVEDTFRASLGTLFTYGIFIFSREISSFSQEKLIHFSLKKCSSQTSP